MLLLYADDAVVMSETPEGLQHMLENLRDYTVKWKLSVNTEKTKVMVFRRGGPLPSNMKFYYDGRELDIVNSFVYLGIVFTYTGRLLPNTLVESSRVESSFRD